MSSKHEPSTSCNTERSDTARRTLEPDDAPRQHGNSRSRRTFLKGIGATAATAAGVSYAGSPVGDAAAFDWKAAGTYALAGPIGLIAYGKKIAGPDEEDVADSLEWNTYVNEFTRAREDNLLLDQTLASLERDVQLVGNKAREEAIFRVYEQAVDSGTESDAVSAAETAINETYTTVEKAILESFNLRSTRFNQILRLHDTQTYGSNVIETGPDTVTNEMYYIKNPETADADDKFSMKTYDLLDGTQVSYMAFARDYGSELICADPVRLSDMKDAQSPPHEYRFFYNKPDHADYETVDEPLDVSYERVTLLDTQQWADVIDKLYDEHSNLISEVSSMVDTYFQPAQDGEYDLTQMLGPKHLTDTASTATDYQEAAMAMRGMGYPLSEQVVTLSLPTEGGDPLEVTGRLSWTAHQGNSLPVGSLIDAGNYPGSIFAAVNVPEEVDSVSGNTTNTTDDGSTDSGPGAEVIELTETFTIDSAEGASEVTFNDRSLATTDTSAEEVEQIFMENYEANKEATENVHDTATGGGGGLSWSSFTTMEKAIAAAAAGLVTLGIVNN
ncbi:twin-arginine translocation signal domain-containing protein [Halorubrum sp. F4]|uniref:twin-arginine translocation signal domain-containing protein n=1 Tax=Halorubrum sp. F4 TaxID=2989715 RepID=UPI002480BC36|nr:twin-arginine translocation signal domain-containing protein [Halorubrum sp. F4]